MHDNNLLEDQLIAWTPTPDVIERAQLTKFMRQIGVATWDELYEFSIHDVEKFTEEVLKFLDIKFEPPYEKLLDTSNGVEFPRWFERSADTPVRMSVASTRKDSLPASDFAGGTGDADKSVRAPSAGLNITTMCLDRWQTDEMKDQPAVIWEGEEGGTRTFSYAMLLGAVDKCVTLLEQAGVCKEDSVGIHMPMLVETVVALLAINRIGGIGVPVFSGYGVDAIASRLKAVKAKVLFTCDSFPRRGKRFDAIEIAANAAKSVETIQAVFICGRITGELEGGEVMVHQAEASILEEWLRRHERYKTLFGELSFQNWFCLEDLPSADLGLDSIAASTSAEDPLIILYTSGTTGRPKGIAHTHASFPIKAAQDMAFGTDVGRGTRICWYTDIGWMMGPWLIYGALINGATICIYDGAPDYPTPDRMWEFCAKHKVEVLGISPTLIRALAGSADTPVRPSPSSFNQSEKSERADKSVRSPRRGWHSRGRLPHFDGEVTQLITFRLADSLPKNVIERIRLDVNKENPGNNSREFRIRIEKYLDQAVGECILRDPAVAEILEETILHEHWNSCVVRAFVIMPNHGHILLRARDGFDLSGIMQRIKGVSARKINKLLEKSGTIWQADYFDRYIRDEEHFYKAIRYIHNNPVKAGLCESAEEWRFSSANEIAKAKLENDRSADTPVRTSNAPNAPEEQRQADKSVRAPARAPFERHDLSSLRIFASTGEPWNPAPWWWLFEKVGNSKLPIINYSGGTEIAGGILMGNPLLPIKPCSFPAPCPGMDVDILDEDGKPVDAGKVGELVIKQPWIGMARGFWQEKERYLETYWRRFKDIWIHGDWAMRDKDGHWFILGRSDDTLKVAGKRVGPAEVESILVSHPQVTEAAVIGVPDEAKGTAMVAFVVRSADTPVPMSVASTRKGADDPESSIGGEGFGGGTADGDKSVSTPSARSVPSPLEEELKALVAKDMGKPLALSNIHFVSALPKTRNAKVMRRVIRAAYLGEDPGDLTALENPNAVTEIGELGK